jgi:stage IV sporulation protein FB
MLIAYAGYAGYQDGLVGAVFAILVLLGMFVCVTLHEYGHALTARRFGIDTLDITLFPIGGVARLLKIPRVPWQEFLVAVAGPAVNALLIVCVAAIIWSVPALGMPSPSRLIHDRAALEELSIAANEPSLLSYLLSMLVVNVALIVFNMIPAFPMDGGRVLRSALAMGLDYRRATRIASNVGILCAVLMAATALYYGMITAGLIAVFICYAGLAEARQVDTIEPLRHLTVGDAMIHRPPFVSLDHPLGNLVDWLRFCPTAAVPVVGPGNIVAGMLTLEETVSAIRAGAEPWMVAGQIARHDVPSFLPDEPLEGVLAGPLEDRRQFAVTDATGRLVGLLDLDSLRTRAELNRVG